MENKFTQEQSVELIKEMIQQAKGNAIEGAQTGVMMLWGYSIFIACTLHFIAWTMELYSYINYIWAGTSLISLIIMFIIIKMEKKTKRVTTYTDTISDNVWLGYGVCTMIVFFVFSGSIYFPMITLLYGFAIFMTATIYKAKIFFISTIIIVACVISYIFIPVAYYPIPMAISMLCGNIIPGHIINSQHKKNVKRA